MSAVPSSERSDAKTDSLFASIMENHGVKVGMEAFHSAVNVAFHEFEAEVYDAVHEDMWQSAPQQIHLLVSDCLQATEPIRPLPQKIRVLDIGCGTGLATDALLKSNIGERIVSIALLDSSPAMLRKAKERSQTWKVPVTINEGLIDSLARGNSFDWIITCSVLHHVPHLKSFIDGVRVLQAPNGVFCHLQDPNGDYLQDAELRKRMETRSRHQIPEWLQKLSPNRVVDKIARELGTREADDLVSKTSRALIAKGVITTPLSAHDLYAITDVHVQNEKGISVTEIGEWMPDWSLTAQRSYGFFGELWGSLPSRYRQMEEDLIAQHALNGFHIGAAWQVRSSY